MTINTRQVPRYCTNASGVVVPSAAVWVSGKPGMVAGACGDVRTLENSNRINDVRAVDGDRGQVGVSNTHYRSVLEQGRRLFRDDSPPTHTRSIRETLMNWMGGALFGLVIVLGIVIAPTQDEPNAPETTRTQFASFEN